MTNKDPLINELNTELDRVTKESIIIAICIGAVSGFIVGIIVASFLHKYIVHPWGW